MIGAIARACGDDRALRRSLRLYQLRALDSIAACGTAACGLHVEVCSNCGDRRNMPNTCGNRSCPHCQGAERLAWVQAREGELLAGVSYFHAVFTMPPELSRLALAYPTVVLGAQLQASADAILMLCAEPKHLGAEVGLVELLHTWTRDLRWHPHVHQIITAGGWDGQRWIPARRQGRSKEAFLLPLELLRAAYQRRLMKLLLDAYEADRFDSSDEATLTELASLTVFRQHLGRISRKKFCIRIEPPFGSPEVLLRYLGRYVNRVAVSPKRVDYDRERDRVSLQWSSNKEPQIQRLTTMSGVEFLAAFAQHILPPHLKRIRFRGLWANSQRRRKLALVRVWLQANPLPAPPAKPAPDPEPPPETPEHRQCLVCGLGTYERQPGPCPRPNAATRRLLLAQIRAQERSPTPAEIIPHA